ncbi:MAG: ABC transporter permease [Anaerolineae bacterium]
MQVSPAASAASANRRHGLLTTLRQQWLLLLLLTPAVIWTVVFNFYPTLLTIPMVFKDYKVTLGIWGSRWVGFGNITRAFAAPDFLRVIGNTLIISSLRLVAGFFPPIILAILTHDSRIARVRRVCQSVTYLPHFLSWPIVWGIILALLSPSNGIIVTLFRNLGTHFPDVFVDSRYFRPLVVLSGVWKELGWGTIIYLAALSGIEPELYEAAVVDGAEWYHRTWYITLPGIIPVVTLLLTLSLSDILNAGFEQIYLFLTPLTYEVGDIIDTWVYRRGLLGADFGLGTAVGFWKSVVGLVLILVANKAAKRLTSHGIW